jgi:uncharacterized protein YndB with AHSA1/START domain
VTSDAESGSRARREVRVERLIAAPRELVFEAWLDPEQVTRWWAPAGYEVPSRTVDIEPWAGGRIHFSMAALDGGMEYPVRFEILELSEPELLVLRSEALPEAGIAEPTVTRVTFENADGGTRVTVTQGPHTDEMHPRALAGWRSCLQNLESLLAA